MAGWGRNAVGTLADATVSTRSRIDERVGAGAAVVLVVVLVVVGGGAVVAVVAGCVLGGGGALVVDDPVVVGPAVVEPVLVGPVVVGAVVASADVVVDPSVLGVVAVPDVVGAEAVVDVPVVADSTPEPSSPPHAAAARARVSSTVAGRNARGAMDISLAGRGCTDPAARSFRSGFAPAERGRIDPGSARTGSGGRPRVAS